MPDQGLAALLSPFAGSCKAADDPDQQQQQQQ
jgi:hypothetical protein